MAISVLNVLSYDRNQPVYQGNTTSYTNISNAVATFKAIHGLQIV